MKSTIKFIYESKSGLEFKVQPELVPEIEKLTNIISETIYKHKKNGEFIAYLSVPISPRGGGDFKTNVEITKAVAKNIVKQFGSKLWVLNPSEYQLPEIAGGGDYMAIWSDILAGDNGRGDDFDLIYFLGPNDVWSFFSATGEDRIGTIENWLLEKSNTDRNYLEIMDDNKKKNNFLKFYGIRGSVAYSKGAHDEWNLISFLNSKRPIGENISIYFDGKPIEPGDYSDLTEAGYEKIE